MRRCRRRVVVVASSSIEQQPSAGLRPSSAGGSDSDFPPACWKATWGDTVTRLLLHSPGSLKQPPPPWQEARKHPSTWRLATWGRRSSLRSTPVPPSGVCTPCDRGSAHWGGGGAQQGAPVRARRGGVGRRGGGRRSGVCCLEFAASYGTRITGSMGAVTGSCSMRCTFHFGVLPCVIEPRQARGIGGAQAHAATEPAARNAPHVGVFVCYCFPAQGVFIPGGGCQSGFWARAGAPAR